MDVEVQEKQDVPYRGLALSWIWRLTCVGEKHMLIKNYIKWDLIAAGPDSWAGRSAEDRLLCKQEAMGSNPIRSTSIFQSFEIAN